MPRYRPVTDAQLVALSPGTVAGACPAAGRELFINANSWFWECLDCGRCEGFFPSQQAADDNWHNSSHVAVGRGRP